MYPNISTIFICGHTVDGRLMLVYHPSRTISYRGSRALDVDVWFKLQIRATLKEEGVISGLVCWIMCNNKLLRRLYDQGGLVLPN